MPKVFLSYVSEDLKIVEKIKESLEDHGIDVWYDKEKLLPGQRWESEILKGVSSGDFFIACFSSAYHSKQVSYMNEELNIAIGELRKRQYGATWFVPLRLDDCNIPEWPIGLGQTLSSLQWVDILKDYARGISKLVETILPHGGESYIHKHYRYFYHILKNGQVRVRTEADLILLKGPKKIGGSGWTDYPEDLKSTTILKRDGVKKEIHTEVTKIERTGPSYWWETEYSLPLIQGDEITEIDTFYINYPPREFKRDSFHAFRAIKSFDWTINFEEPLVALSWYASCDYVKGLGDNYILYENKEPTNRIQYSFGEVSVGGVYYLNWDY